MEVVISLQPLDDWPLHLHADRNLSDVAFGQGKDALRRGRWHWR